MAMCCCPRGRRAVRQRHVKDDATATTSKQPTANGRSDRPCALLAGIMTGNAPGNGLAEPTQLPRKHPEHGSRQAAYSIYRIGDLS